MCTLRYKRWIIIKASRVRNYLAYFLGINFILCEGFFFFFTLDGPLPPPAVSRGYLGSTRNFVAKGERRESLKRNVSSHRDPESRRVFHFSLSFLNQLQLFPKISQKFYKFYASCFDNLSWMRNTRRNRVSTVAHDYLFIYLFIRKRELKIWKGTFHLSITTDDLSDSFVRDKK